MHTLIIDTSAYSGNFERELCQYLTGQSGEYGDYGTEGLQHQEWWDKHLRDRLVDRHDSPHRSPVWITPTPGLFNNGTGLHLADTPENEAIALEYQRAYWLQQGWTPRDKAIKYPAYQSVAILVESPPPEDVMAELRKRAEEFAQTRGFSITDIRLLEGLAPE